MSATITNALPDIPRLYTALCEWLACIVYLSVIYRRVGRKKSAMVVAAGLPVMIALQYWGGMMSKQFWILGMLLAFTGMCAIILTAAGIGKREALYLTARAFVLAELIASLHWQLVTFLHIGWRGENARWQSVAMLVVVYSACFAFAWFVERNNFSRITPTVPSRSMTIGTVSITTVTFAMSNLSFVSTNTPFSGTVGQEVFYIRTLVDFCGFVILYAQQEQSRRLATNAELSSIDAQLRSQHQEYLQSKTNLESLGRLAHDLKHQIAALKVEADPNHLAQGFEQLEASVQRYSAQKYSGNPVLDVILTSKTRQCDEHGITLTAVADGKLLNSMSSMDIATLFGNALDNAIEATLGLGDSESRLIRLALFSRNRFIVIRIENFFDSHLRTDSVGNLQTTKHDKDKHGYGMKSIRHIAEKYGGEISVHAQDHWFVLSIVIPE
ncbi:MAG: GHKL domain-containing protein [Bifidobacterium aquikefiri]|uniref:Histidine kinase n=1 Tax=Bifidobacterium aquikefiri TaxID=1653207 RepID=A0A261GA86_9BIFI|nr:ATP-binding protein [Bifidobacterium aquikefiri]OZG68347.1 histidine kinase [Bifidobacterium aquikefiri]